MGDGYVGNVNELGPSSAGGGAFGYPLNPSGRFISGLQVTRGTVLLSFQSLQYYAVTTDFGLVYAFFQGASRGRLGAMESGGFSPGQEVWVAYSPQFPNLNSFIIGSAGYPLAGAYTSPGGLLVYPQVAGFQYGQNATETAGNQQNESADDTETQGIPQRMAGQMYANVTRVRNMNAGFQDGTDGDWSMRNQFGGGVGVEMFRTFLQGGPMSGVYCYTEDGQTRIVGAKYQLITTGTEFDDYVQGVSLVTVDRRVYYPMDAVFENVPQRLAVSGPMYGGEQVFQTYRDKDNLSVSQPIPGTVNRVALIHEYRGLDGSYVLSTAGSLTLQKRVGIRVPIEIIEDPAQNIETPSPILTDPDTCDIPGPEYNAFQQPMDNGVDAGNVAKNLRIVSGGTSGIAGILGARGLADKLIDWQARGGFDKLTKQWRQGEDSKKVYPTGNPDEPLWNPDPTMWKCVPRTIGLNLDSYGASKTFYMGRALIQITEDGGIVLQDAYGSQIAMSGGNIFLSANHDVITVAGRNHVTVAGRDATIRADRHLDLNANTGRAVLAAAGELSLSGGHGGRGGVLIESKGDAEEVIDQGGLPGSAGGVVIRATKTFSVDCVKAHIRARRQGWSARADGSGTILLDSGDQVLWRAKNNDYRGSFGANILAKLDGCEVLLGKNSFLNNLTVRQNLYYTNQLYSKTSLRANELTIQLSAKLAVLLNAVYDMGNAAVTKLQTKFLSSAQYNITGSTTFTIPEPDWQQRAKNTLPATSAALQALMHDQPYAGTAPLPGSDAWNGYGLTTQTVGPNDTVVIATAGADHLLKGV